MDRGYKSFMLYVLYGFLANGNLPRLLDNDNDREVKLGDVHISAQEIS